MSERECFRKFDGLWDRDEAAGVGRGGSGVEVC